MQREKGHFGEEEKPEKVSPRKGSKNSCFCVDRVAPNEFVLLARITFCETGVLRVLLLGGEFWSA